MALKTLSDFLEIEDDPLANANKQTYIRRPLAIAFLIVDVVV